MSLINVIKLAVPEVTSTDVEDYLATDDLFIDYFNCFLSLPVFPEPMCFNKVTGGFEVVSSARKELAQKIKATVESQKIPSRMYRLAKKHCFSDIPLLHLQPESPEVESKEIETSFQVMTLNKEQGIHWVKEQRLPAFLQSDYYREYQLAKILSQVQIIGPNGEYIVMEIDYKPEVKKQQVEVDEIKTDPIDDKMKELYVCMGNAATLTQTQAWYSSVVNYNATNVSFSASVARSRASSVVSERIAMKRGGSGRPASVYSSGDSGRDSGYTGPAKSAFTESRRSSRVDSGNLSTFRGPVSAAPKPESMPNTPRPTGEICVIWPEHEYQPPVYYKHSEGDAKIGDVKHVSIARDSLVKHSSDNVSDTSLVADKSEGILLSAYVGTLDEVGALIASDVLRASIAQVNNIPLFELPNIPVIDDLIRSSKPIPKEVEDRLASPAEIIIPEMYNSGLLKYEQIDLDLTKTDATVATKNRVKFTTDDDNISPVKTVSLDSTKKKTETTMMQVPKSASTDSTDSRGSDSRKDNVITISNTARNSAQLQKPKLYGTGLSSENLTNNSSNKCRTGDKSNNSYISTNSTFHANMTNSNSLKAIKNVKYDQMSPPDTPTLQCRHKKVKAIKQSDNDSLLDSDDDYDPEDIYFRPKVSRISSFERKKGVDDFKEFISGTVGEKQWNLWLDIEKSRLMTDDKSLNQYLYCMSKKYHLAGSKYELSIDTRIRLGLTEAVWTLDLLKAAQNKCAEPLILYWATRFLLEQPSPQPTLSRPRTTQVPRLLPHRPKTCKPRLQHTAGPLQESYSAYWKPVKAFSNAYRPTHPDIDTPNVRMMLSHPCGDTNTWLTQLAYHAPRANYRRSYLPDSLDKIYPLKPSFKPKQQAQKKNTQVSPPLPQFMTPKMIVDWLKKSRDRPNSARPKSVSVMTPVTSKRSLPGKHAITSTPLPDAKPRPFSAAVGITDYTDVNEVEDNIDDGIGMSSASSHHSDDSLETVSSQFQGGRRMEALLQALAHEKLAGGFFRSFVERSENQLWLNSLDLWHAIQDYHDLFYDEVIDEYTVSRKARAIFATYVVEGSPQTIKCPPPVANKIYRRLTPPYEDLYDTVEEMSLDILFLAWVDMLSQDMRTSSRVQQVEVKRLLETKSRLVLNLQKRGILKQRVMTPEDPMAGFTDPMYDSAIFERIPVDFRDYTLDKLVHNRIELENFRDFLATNYASMDIQCWMDIEAFRRLSPSEEKRCDNKAKELRLKYLNKKYFFGPSSPAGKAGQDKVMEIGGGWGKLLDDRPPNAVILEAQKYVLERLEKKWLVMFMATPGFIQRQKPPPNMEDVIEDAIMQKRRKTHHMLKLMESKWVSSAKEIITFRKALMNPVTSHQFRRFVSIKGDSLENDVLFWIEVQKYKDIHHQCDENLITQKINAIINCFIDSYMPPQIHIDIAADQAEKIVDRKHEKGPYLFRDAQLTVFRVLFSHWNEFCDYRSKITDDKIMSTIERRRKQAKKVERARQRQFEEQERVRQEYQRNSMDYDNSDPFNDHELSHTSENGEPIPPGEKDSVSWSYSVYCKALEHEQRLNNMESNSHTSVNDSAGSLKSSLLNESKKVDADISESKKSIATQRSTEKLNSSNNNSSRKDSLFNDLDRRTSEAKINKKSKRNSISKKMSITSIK